MKKSPSPQTVDALRQTANTAMKTCSEEIELLKEYLLVLEHKFNNPFSSKKDIEEYVTGAALVTQDIAKLVSSTGTCILAVIDSVDPPVSKLH